LTGVNSDDEDFFTDVIYRCNQVFEGILKELYEVETQKPVTKNTTPYKIESYLEKQDRFKSRILKSFTTYRQDWRNPSTHDHKIDFNEQEAFIAISNVSAFCYVAISQMIYWHVEKQVKISDEKRFTFVEFDQLGPNLVYVLKTTYAAMQEKQSEGQVLAGPRALEEVFSGIISRVSFNAEVSTEYTVSSESRQYQIDVFVDHPKNKFAYEIKGYSDTPSLDKHYRGGVEHLARLVSEDIANFGILLLLPRDYVNLDADEFAFEVLKENSSILVVSLKANLTRNRPFCLSSSLRLRDASPP